MLRLVYRSLRISLTCLVLLCTTVGLHADVMSTPITYIQGTFVGGFHVPTPSTVTFENGVVIQLDSPMHGKRIQQFTIDVDSMSSNPGSVKIQDSTTSGYMTFALHGMDGEKAVFQFLGLPNLTAGGENNHLAGTIRLISNTLSGIDLSAFQTGGTFDMYFSANEVIVDPGDGVNPGSIGLGVGPASIPAVGGNTIGSGAWFVLQAGGRSGGGGEGGGGGGGGGGNTGTDVPEPASLAIFGLLLPAGYWAYRRRQA